MLSGYQRFPQAHEINPKMTARAARALLHNTNTRAKLINVGTGQPEEQSPQHTRQRALSANNKSLQHKR